MSILKVRNNGQWEYPDVAHATSATNDGDGNEISTTYLPLVAGQNTPITGPLYLTNNNPALVLNNSSSNIQAELTVSNLGTMLAATNSNNVIGGLIVDSSGTLLFGNSNNIYLRPNGSTSTSPQFSVNQNGYFICTGRVLGLTANSDVTGVYPYIQIVDTANDSSISVRLYNQGGSTIIRNYDTTDTQTSAFTFNSSGFIVAPGVYSNTATGSANIVVDSSGNIKRASSLLALKTDVKDITDEDADKGYNLRPISFKAKNKEEDQHTQYGLIAEEVEKILPNLATYDSDGKVSGVAYDRVCAILLKQVQILKERLDKLETKK